MNTQKNSESPTAPTETAKELDCPDVAGSEMRIKYRGKSYEYCGKNFLERLTGIKGFVANEVWWCRDENCEAIHQNSVISATPPHDET
jgi:hypothetical protein